MFGFSKREKNGNGLDILPGLRITDGYSVRMSDKKWTKSQQSGK